jgi:hypothetical protein
MATETVKDYLGHPCLVARAFENFTDAVDAAREDAAKEPREIARNIGKALNRINERLGHQQGALRLLGDRLANQADADGESGVIAMASQYEIETSNEFFDLAGLVLVALEQGKLVEVAHG